MAGARVVHIGGVGRDAKAIPAGRRDAHRRDEARIPDGCRRGLDAVCVTCDDAGARIVDGRIATADTNTARDGAVIVDRCPRTEHHAEIVSRHRRAGLDIVGVVVVVNRAVAVGAVLVGGLPGAGDDRVVDRRGRRAGRLDAPAHREGSKQQRLHQRVSSQNKLRAGHVCFCSRAGFFFADAGESQYSQAKPPSEQPQHTLNRRAQTLAAAAMCGLDGGDGD